MATTNDLQAYHELDEAITRLVWLAWDRWHPPNPETQDKAHESVYAGLIDVRRISHELEALWIRLGVTDLGIVRDVPSRDLKDDCEGAVEPDPTDPRDLIDDGAELREFVDVLDSGRSSLFDVDPEQDCDGDVRERDDDDRGRDF